jgi:NADH dehydrogenase
MKDKTLPRIVIVGAGFGGLSAAKKLADRALELVVIDQKNHHTFQPLLYQVATAGLSPGDIASPIRSILSSQENTEVLLAEVTGFDLEQRLVHTPQKDIAYDYLIVAAGARHSYFGHPEWEALAPGLKTLEDAIEIRRRVLLAFELAEREAVEGEPEMPLNFVVVGAGPTGVELAGTLAEICTHALAHDFRSINPRRTRIQLVEGGPRVLPAYAEDLSRSALQQLQQLGVEVVLNAMVTNVAPGMIRVGDKEMKAAAVLWAAGVAASPLGAKLGVPVDRAGRVAVNADLSLPNHPEVFVIGDLAALKDASGKLLPGVAPVAMQEGKFVAREIRRSIEFRSESKNGSSGKPPAPAVFHYVDKGSLATIGRAAAIGQFGKIHISGFIAWLAWLFIHVFFLIGFRNRVLVLLQGAWSYFTYQRGARLITGGNNLPGWSGKPDDAGGPHHETPRSSVA